MTKQFYEFLNYTKKIETEENKQFEVNPDSDRSKKPLQFMCRNSGYLCCGQ